MKRKRTLLTGMVIGLPVLTVLAAAVLVGLQWRQDQLDAALYQALLNRDVKATTRLLEQGADARATYPLPDQNPAGKASWWAQLWNQVLHRKPAGQRIGALLVPTLDCFISWTFSEPGRIRRPLVMPENKHLPTIWEVRATWNVKTFLNGKTVGRSSRPPGNDA